MVGVWRLSGYAVLRQNLDAFRTSEIRNIGVTSQLCTQNVYISLSEWFYQNVREVNDTIPGPHTTLQTIESVIIINKKEA